MAVSSTMAAKDYIFVEGLGGIYLAKRIADPRRISQDRRLIEDNEILALFEALLRRNWHSNKTCHIEVSNGEGKKIFFAKLLDEPDE